AGSFPRLARRAPSGGGRGRERAAPGGRRDGGRLASARRDRLAQGGADRHPRALSHALGLEPQPAQRDLGAILHAGVLGVEIAGEAAELELDAVGIPEVDRPGQSWSTTSVTSTPFASSSRRLSRSAASEPASKAKW